MNAPPQSSLTWTKEVDERLIYTALLIIAFPSAMRVGEWAAQRTVTDKHWRSTIRQLIRYTGVSISPVSTLGIGAHCLQGLLLVLGATGDWLVIALAPVIFSMADWAPIILSNQYTVGHHVQFGG